jgi:hypothetical protein
MENSKIIACRGFVCLRATARKSGSCNVIKEVAIAKVTHSFLPAKPYRFKKPTHFLVEWLKSAKWQYTPYLLYPQKDFVVGNGFGHDF